MAASRGAVGSEGSNAVEQQRLSYKYQRLRERLRAAIESGELKGKLPGERELAKMFEANPKTMGKALTDLAAEGLLDRRIGRGTYTRGTAPDEAAAGDRWLILTGYSPEKCSLLRELMAMHEHCEVRSADQPVRPSYLGRFDAVLDLSEHTPEQVTRELAVRNIPLVLLDRMPKSLMTHAVVADRRYAAFIIGRDLILQGHKHLIAVEDRAPDDVATGLKMAAQQYGKDVKVTSWQPDALSSLRPPRHAAIVCTGINVANNCHEVLSKSHKIPEDLSLVAIGCENGRPKFSGCYCQSRALVEFATRLLRQPPLRPLVTYLVPEYVDRGTVKARTK